MSSSPEPEPTLTWRHILAIGWAVLITGLYFARQVPPQWPKVYERYIAPLLGR